MLGILLLGASDASGDGWTRRPCLTFSLGNESERILERTPLPVTIPGDYFVGFQPGIVLSHPLPAGMRLEFDGMATVERFHGDQDRALLGVSVNGEISQRFATRWRWRAAMGADRFDDSVDETLNQSRFGGELALGLLSRRAYAELVFGLSHRRFHDLYTWDGEGGDTPYRDLGALVGVTGAVMPARWIELSGMASRQSTTAQDPLFDSTTRLVQGGIRYLGLARLQVLASVLFQERRFSDWYDTYRQGGLGLVYAVGDGLDMSLRYARGQYESPVRDSDGVWRLSVALTWRPGGDPSMFAALSQTGLFSADNAGRVQAGEHRLFRVLAPEARRVSLVGDFNAWNPGTHRMQPVAEGWWEVSTTLPSGSHQYAYWVDGSLVTPPESEIVVDDGFGGRNGVVHVEPGGL